MKTSVTNVETTIVSSDDGVNTYEVKKRLLDGKGNPAAGKDAILIGLHPTTNAGEPYKTDLSTNHLVCKMPELGLRSVRILNLFSQVQDFGKLPAKGLEVDEENLRYIESAMKEPGSEGSPVIAAWGNGMASSKAANLTKARISDLLGVYRPKGDLCQLSAPSLSLDSEECAHVLYLGIRHKRETWSLREYRFPKKETPVEKPEKKGRKKAPKPPKEGPAEAGSPMGGGEAK